MNSNYATGLQHVGIPTEHLGMSVDFYKKLGFKVYFRSDDVVFMKLNALLIELYINSNTSRKAGAIDHISLNVKDVESVFSEFRSSGFKILDSEIKSLPFFENGVRFFTIEGPNGEKIEFNELIKK